MTSSRVRIARPRSRSRNRKRAGSLWKRIAGLRGCIRPIGRGLRRSVPAMIAAVLASGVAVGGYYGYGFITTSERFAVQRIEVRGNRAVPDEHVISLLGIERGDNIFRVEVDALADALEESEPMIASASVSRRLPDTLLVDIEEREAAALVELGGLYLADADGRVFRRASMARGDGADLPVITGLTRDEYIRDAQSVEDKIRRALEAVAVYRSGGERERPALGGVDLHPRRGVTFTTFERAIAVRVGNGERAALRARLHAFDTAWQALTKKERERVRIVYADSSNRPDRVTVGFQH